MAASLHLALRQSGYAEKMINSLQLGQMLKMGLVSEGIMSHLAGAGLFLAALVAASAASAWLSIDCC